MSNQNSRIKTIIVYNLAIAMIAVCYSYLRYVLHQFRLPDSEIIYIVNKGLAFTASASISLSYIIGNLSKIGKIDIAKFKGMPKLFGVTGFLTASVHIIISLMLLSKERFPYLYLPNGNFNFTGEMTILFGVISFAFFMMPAITSISSVKNAMNEKSWRNYQQIGYIGAFSVMTHILFVDYVNLFEPSGWKFFLIPISAVSLILLAVAITLKLYNLIKSIVRAFRT